MEAVLAMETIPIKQLERFWGLVDVSDSTSCWLWKLSAGNHGYGQFGYWINNKPKTYLAHRIAYFLSKGSIPLTLTVDHICHVRKCCNPDHLRLLTNIENARDNNARQMIRTKIERGIPLNGIKVRV